MFSACMNLTMDLLFVLEPSFVRWAAEIRHNARQHGLHPVKRPDAASLPSFQLSAGRRSLQQEQLDGVPTGGQGVASGGGGVDETRPWPPPRVPLPLALPPQPGLNVSITDLPTLLQL